MEIDLGQIAVWLIAGGGALVVAGSLSSFLLENWKWFQGLTSDERKWFVRAVALGIATLAQVYLLLPPDYKEVVNPWLSLVISFIITFSGQQLFHKFINKR